jgi:hypothetical protein
VTVKDVKKCCTSIALGEADNDILWNGSEEDVNAGSEWGEDEALIEDGDSDNDWW